MKRFYEAGADVPRPLATNRTALLMEYIGSTPDTPAPPLVGVTLERREARDLFERIIHNVALLLENDLVHGDLSAYNVLYSDGRIVLIDFPQAVDARFNRDAFTLLTRDVANLCR